MTIKRYCTVMTVGSLLQIVSDRVRIEQAIDILRGINTVPVDPFHPPKIISAEQMDEVYAKLVTLFKELSAAELRLTAMINLDLFGPIDDPDGEDDEDYEDDED